MKENSDIEELLNSFVDGELTQRQFTELQRLISHDEHLARRVRELQKCKSLLASLPCTAAPNDTAERIIAALERKTLLGQQSVTSRAEERRGARHLLLRKLVSAAAMVALVAVLGAVIYTIVAPQSGPEKPAFVENWQKPPESLQPTKSAVTPVAVVKKTSPKPHPTAIPFDGALELKATNFVAVDAFINRAIKDNNRLDCSIAQTLPNESTYILSGDPKAFALLMTDLESIWSEINSATLFVETDRFANPIVIDRVNTTQITEILKRNTLDERIKVARDFAILNNIAGLLPAKNVLAAINDTTEAMITIPKPVLTSNEKTALKPAGSTQQEPGKVNLTLTIKSDK